MTDMDLIIEFILELVLEGSINAASNRKAPPVLRILAIILLACVYLLLTVGLILIGIGSKSTVMIVIGAVLTVVLTVPAVKIFKKGSR